MTACWPKNMLPHAGSSRIYDKEDQTSNTSTDRTSPINIVSLAVIGVLGQGGFSDVVRVKDTKTGENYAMKVIAKKPFT